MMLSMTKGKIRTEIEWDALRPRLAKLKKAELLEVLKLAFNALPKTRLSRSSARTWTSRP